jgi:hypothetical protein
MDRKEFLKTTAGAGLGCGVAVFLSRVGVASAEVDQTAQCTRRLEFVRGWVQDIMAQMDAQLDQPARERLMEACGRSCFAGAVASGFCGPQAKEHKAPPDFEAWLTGFQKAVGPEQLYREGDVIHFKYRQNPRGLKIADGYCLCPILEDGPRQLSPTYCHCSVGYVTGTFEHGSGRKVKVELIDSLRRGGKECHFVVRLA